MRKYKQTILASLFAIALISTAYYFGTHAGGSAASDASVSNEARAALAHKDTDGDGISDYEEGVRGTNPLVPETFGNFSSSTRTDDGGEDVPDNTTSRFSRNFLGEYMRITADGEMTEEEKADFLRKSAAEASVNAKDTLYSRGDIRVGLANDPATVRAYGNAIGRIMTAEPVRGDNELFIVQRALQTDTAETLVALDPLITTYKHMVENTRATEVPVSLINEHLALLNALLAIHNDIVAMRNIFDDGLPALVRVQRYPGDVDALYNVLVGLRLSFARTGAAYGEGEPGTFFSQFQPQ